VFSVPAQSPYFSNESKLSVFLQKISNYVHLFLRQYLCLVALVLAVTAGLEERGKSTIYGVSIPLSLSGAVIRKLFDITEDKISEFSLISSRD